MRLPRLSPSPAALSRVLFYAVVAAVPLSAFLAFSVQPLVGKLLLPVQGGAASTWLGAMVYFQSTLLLGYAWAAWLLLRTPRIQIAATGGLALVAVVCSRLAWVRESHWTGLGGILLTLALATLPAMVLLFSTGPLMHGWLRRRGQPVPFHLYAFSNAGGLAGVVLYPFIIERAAGLFDQTFYWQGFLWVLAGLLATAGLCYRRLDSPDPAADRTAEPVSGGRIVLWMGLSMLTCVGMLGATHHVAAEIGSTPLAWVGPFGVYLLSFLVTFSSWWQPRFTLACLGWLAISLTGFMLTKGASNATVDGPAVFWLMSLTAAGSFFGNGLIHETRPTHRFSLYYLVLAAGGVLGGLFASLGAPLLFLRPSEFYVVSCALLILGLVRLIARREALTVAVVIVIVAAPVAGVVCQQTHEEAAGTLRIRRFRDIYGYMILKSVKDGMVLSNETITHGTQITNSPEARRHPTLYYTESSGLGCLINGIKNAHPSMNMAVIGLGAGTLAAYARAADRVDFWDIDPKAIRMARSFFTFVSDSPAQIHIDQADGRKGLEASSTDYDLIVVDAYTGDGIPAHLLTREALAVYFSRLDKRHGLVAIHTTNRYSNFFPVIAATARTLDWTALKVATTSEIRDWDCTDTQYVFLCRPYQLRQVIAWLPTEEEDGRVKRTLTQYDAAPPDDAIFWTDDRNAALDALDLRRYLAGR